MDERLDDPTFGERIREIREQRGLSLREAARRGNGAFRHETLLRIELDERQNPSLNTLIGVASAIGIRFVIEPDALYVEETEYEGRP